MPNLAENHNKPAITHRSGFASKYYLYPMVKPIPLSVRKFTRRGVYSVCHWKSVPWKNCGVNGIVAGNGFNPVNAVNPNGNAVIKTNSYNGTYEVRPWTKVDAGSWAVANFAAGKYLWSSVLMTIIDGANFKRASVAAGQAVGDKFDKANMEDYGGGKVMGLIFSVFGKLLDFSQFVSDLKIADSDGFQEYWDDNLKGIEFGSKDEATAAVSQYYDGHADEAPDKIIFNDEN